MIKSGFNNRMRSILMPCQLATCSILLAASEQVLTKQPDLIIFSGKAEQIPTIKAFWQPQLTVPVIAIAALLHCSLTTFVGGIF